MPTAEKKIFNELLDADTAPHLISASAFLNGLNLRFGTTDDGLEGFFENIKGNTLVPVTLPETGDNICIGACVDDSNQHIIFFNYNSDGSHGIYLYDVVGQTMYTVVTNDDVTGELNFSKYHLINGAYVINGVLYFTDNYNPPRSLNLAAFMTASGASPVTAEYDITFPVDASEITLIKKPCPFPPGIAKSYDAGFANNYIKNDSFMFASQYLYYDGEAAVLSPWSKASLLNLSSENYNRIVVTHPVVSIPQAVRYVRIVVKDSLTEKTWVIKTWDREIAADATAINSGSLSVNFYNNVAGEFIDDATIVRPFHSVPEYAGTLAPAKNRILLADVIKGKDTPVASSLSASPTNFTISLTGITVPLLKLGHARVGILGSSSVFGYYWQAYGVYLPGGNGVLEGFYYVTSSVQSSVNTGPGIPTTPAFGPVTSSPQAFSNLTFAGLTFANLIENTRPSGAGVNPSATTIQYNTSAGANLQVTGLSTSSYRVFKSNSQYNLGVVFYDQYLRKTGVVFDGTQVTIPQRNYAYTTGYGNILWTLDNADALNEIPDWAHYYSVVMTKNLRTRNFVAAYTANTCYYATRDTNGLLEYTSQTWVNNAVAIAIDSAGLLQANLGYAYTEGDQCVIIDNSGNTHELPVIGQDGNYILLAPKDVGALTTKTFVYEIYTPHKPAEQEPFFEVGEVFSIIDPGTSSRTYGTLLGAIRADSVVLSRNFGVTTYLADAMSPNDIYFSRWFTDAGRPNIQTRLGQVHKPTGVCFSNVYIPGTQQNGLSAFDALDEEILPETMGAIRKLILAGKVQQEGTVMLAIGENETASIYLGEAQIFDQNQSSFLVKTSGFIGQINILQGSFGTQNPESVAEFQGKVYWADVKSRKIVRYGLDGLFPISDYKFRRAFNLFCKQYASMSQADIETLGSRPYLFGGIDEYHGEYLLSIPKVLADPPKMYLDYESAGVVDCALYSISTRAESGGYTQAARAYAVLVNDIAPSGWYIVSNTVTLGTVTAGEIGYPTLPAAPTSADLADLEYAGASEADLALYLAMKMPPQNGDPVTVYEQVLADLTTDIPVDTAGAEIPYPYDIYDGRAKVLVYKIQGEKWSTPHDYEPEMFVCSGVTLFAFKNGQPWLQNSSTTFNKFFGVKSKSMIAFVGRNSQDPSKVKTWQSISAEVNIKPTFTHFRTETPNIQSSDLDSADYVNREGVFYAPILRDRLSPNVTGSANHKLWHGDKVRGPYVFVMMEWTTEALLQLRFVNVGGNTTPGHEFV